jgi:hypothetical protein
MRLFKMQMTAPHQDYFCLPVLIELAMTYFRRNDSQERRENQKKELKS